MGPLTVKFVGETPWQQLLLKSLCHLKALVHFLEGPFRGEANCQGASDILTDMGFHLKI